MIIIRSRLPASLQQIAFVDTETGEWNVLQIRHREEAETFYYDLTAQSTKCA